MTPEKLPKPLTLMQNYIAETAIIHFDIDAEIDNVVPIRPPEPPDIAA